MVALRLIDALPDFSAPNRETAVEPAPPHAPEVQPPPLEPPDVSEIVRMEVAVAEEAMRIKLETDFGEVLEAERAAHQQALDAQAERLGREAAGVIETGFSRLERNVVDLLSDQVARILGGLLAEDLQKRSIASLSARIIEACRTTDAIRIEVRGSPSMFAGLSSALGERAANIDFIEADGLDLSATIDGTVFETRLSQWSEILSGIFQ
ncbi:MAG: hypothetical protein KF914_02065 [Rhizobiaceae bacterium]|nr:hypothetical protein [Rhizobiaceae bacterium]